MTRRQFASTLTAGLAASSSASAQRDAAKILIGGLEIYPVHVYARGDWILVRLGTNEGLQGIGEASDGGSDKTTVQYLRQFAEMLKNRSVFDIEWLRTTAAAEITTGKPGAPCALSALEQCLFDIIGQALNLPAYDPFGGALRTEIRNYANINRSTDPRTPGGFAMMAERALNAGVDAVKLAP